MPLKQEVKDIAREIYKPGTNSSKEFDKLFITEALKSAHNIYRKFVSQEPSDITKREQPAFESIVLKVYKVETGEYLETAAGNSEWKSEQAIRTVQKKLSGDDKGVLDNPEYEIHQYGISKTKI